MAKKEAECTTIDPKAAALAFLKINLGSKNIRTLSKDEVHAAFLKPVSYTHLRAHET